VARLPVLFLPGSKFVCLHIKVSCSSSCSDILVQGELLHGSPTVCAVQYPLDLHELVLWDVVLLSKVKVK